MGDLEHEVVAPYLEGGHHLVIDCGYIQNEVFEYCRQFGWRPFRGDKSKHYVVENVRQIWTCKPHGVPPLKVTYFSSAGAKDVLSMYMTGQAGQWHLPENVPNEYLAQLLAEVKTQRLNKDGLPTGEWEWKVLSRNNHWLDCECMQIVAALDYSMWAVKNGNQPLIGGL